MARRPHPGTMGRMHTILIIDDHRGFRVQARALLEAEGFTVLGEASDGASGLHVARLLRPDLILLDIGLPDIEGFDVARALGRSTEHAVRGPDQQSRGDRVRTAAA